MSKDRPRSERFEQGLKARRTVLGDEYVDRSLAAADDFNWPMQVFATEVCWDGCWNRPGLDWRSRSLLNLGMIAALNRPAELKLHIRGALKNGCSAEELQEVLLLLALYCGIPAANEAHRIAAEILREHKQK